MIKTVSQMPEVDRRSRIRKYATDLLTFLTTGGDIGQYILEPDETLNVAYQRLRNAARIYGYNTKVSIAQREGKIYICRKNTAKEGEANEKA